MHINNFELDRSNCDNIFISVVSLHHGQVCDMLFLLNILFFRMSISQIGKPIDNSKTTIKFSKNNFQNEKKQKRKISVNFRILFDYLQMVSIIQNIKFQWPNYLAEYFKVFSYFSFSTQIFSFDCFSYEYRISFSPIYIKLIFTQIMPLFICSIFISFFCFCLSKRSNRDLQLTKTVVVIFVVFTYSQLSTISQLFNMISCIKIDNLSYLSSDFHFVCWTKEHQIWV